MRQPNLRHTRNRKGVTLVETSIVMSVFVLLTMGLIEVSQLGMTSQILTTAAGAGCRVAVIDGHSQADVTSEAASVLSAAGISSSSYTLTTTPGDVTTSHQGDSVTVTITVPYRNISWLGTPLFLGSATLKSSATLSSERP